MKMYPLQEHRTLDFQLVPPADPPASNDEELPQACRVDLGASVASRQLPDAASGQLPDAASGQLPRHCSLDAVRREASRTLCKQVALLCIFFR